MARPRKFDEGTVIEAARNQFWHHGYEGTSMAQLCEATGVASQSLYGAFGSKHDLFVRTLDDYCGSQVTGLAQSEGAASDSWAWLMAAVTFEDDGRLGLTRDGCYLSDSAAALSRLDDKVRDASQRTFTEILRVFATALTRAKAQEAVRADVNVEEAALALLVAMQGVEFLRKSGLDDEQFEKAKAGTIAALSQAFTIRGEK
ncbi:TetR/AcrR family transcriptional regulator [Nocardioides houyundeii]|uniref:TetR/AcrR family transcriptional regulator n=1 Tax=Nocardioides houyundeii TaxID=2045452 RepID=UPI000DF284EC|nr:TetR/AcrR family transcriptional regulator [Nocardioides houyundeii]